MIDTFALASILQQPGLARMHLKAGKGLVAF
jgi:hypothetical protein